MTYVYQNPWLKVREDKYQQSGRNKLYGVVERSDTVVIIPLTKSLNTLLLNQWRHPTQSYSQELPMGGIDEGESPEEAAYRELEEEGTMQAGHLRQIGKFVPVPGLSNQTAYVFIASVTEEELQAAKLDSSHEDDIDNLTVVNLQEVNELVLQGKITDGFTLGSLLLLKLFLAKDSC